VINAEWENSKTPFVCPPIKKIKKEKYVQRGTPGYHSLPSLCRQRK
jgi:hypothetical protein